MKERKTMNSKELFARFDKAIAECLMIPNDLLPESYQDHRTTHVNLGDIMNRLQDKETENEKEEKEYRVKRYAAQIANGENIQYIPRQKEVTR